MEYDEKTLRHDVALIELSHPAKITHYVSPVCLPNKNMTHLDLLSEIVEVAGWGNLNSIFTLFPSTFLISQTTQVGLISTTLNHHQCCKL